MIEKINYKNDNNIGFALDIDETLSLTMGGLIERVQKIFGNPENLSVDNILKKYNHMENVPYRQTNDIKDWITDKLQDDIFWKTLNPVLGSVEYVNKIHQITPIISYISARPDYLLIPTKHWLKASGFPNAEIILMPEIENRIPNEWKAEVLMGRKDIIGIVDDNKGLSDFLLEEYHGNVFLLGHIIYDGDKKFVIPCKDWKSVYEHVKKKTSFDLESKNSV